MKKILAVLVLTLVVFTNTGVAHALTWQDVKNFLIGENEPREEESVDDTEVVENTASILSLLKAGDIVRIAEADEVVKEDVNTSTFSFTVEHGDTVWGKVDAQLTAAIPGIENAQKLYTIDRIIDEMRALNRESIISLGVSSGNVDLIYPTESITFAVEVQESGEPIVLAL